MENVHIPKFQIPCTPHTEAIASQWMWDWWRFTLHTLLRRGQDGYWRPLFLQQLFKGLNDRPGGGGLQGCPERGAKVAEKHKDADVPSLEQSA